MITNFADRAAPSSVRRTSDGYLVADVKVVRTGIQVYRGSEVGRPELDLVSVYRPPEEVFHKDSVSSFAHAPLTLDHPTEAVDASNWGKYAVGESGGDVMRDGEHLRIPLIVKDAKAIKAAETSHKELSAGYSCELVWEDGVDPQSGQPYQAKQTKIRANHIAAVRKGRAGPECRIGDEADAGGDAPLNWGASPITKDEEINMKTIMVDGIPVPCTDESATVISTLQARLTAKDEELKSTTSAHAATIAAKDKDIATRDAQIDDLKTKVMSDADLDKLVSARADTVAKAKKVADADYTGKSVPEIRRIAVAKKLGDAAIKDKSDDYVEARFDMLVDGVTKDPVRTAAMDGLTQTGGGADLQTLADAAAKAHADRVESLQKAYKGPDATAH